MLTIENRKISKNNQPLIIPEIGINHLGKLNLAFKIVDEAKKAGAEIIKHQTHTIEDEMSIEAKNIKPGNSKKDIYSIIKDNSLSEEDEFKLFKYVKSKKMIYISTPFSRTAVDRLVKLNVPAFKIGSGEMSNYPLLDYICKFKKPLIVSTGMHDMKQIQKTSNFLVKRSMNFALMHTTNIYPTSDNLLRLSGVTQLKKKFPKTTIGLSDHTGDLLSSIVGMTLGADIVEKHFVHSKKIKGPDISSSIDGKQLEKLIDVSKRIKLQLQGDKTFNLKQEEVTRRFAFASVVATTDIKKGDILSKKNLWVMRPGTGYFKSSALTELYGKKTLKNIAKNTQIKKNDIK